MLVDGKEIKFSSANSSHQVDITPTVLLNLLESFSMCVRRDGGREFEKNVFFIKTVNKEIHVLKCKLYSEKFGIVPCVLSALSENYITMSVNYVCVCVFVVLL